MSDEDICKIKKILIIACGSAYHAGITGKYVLEGLAVSYTHLDVYKRQDRHCIMVH